MRWEYSTVAILDVVCSAAQEMLNTAGRSGWELVAVDDGIAYFKRQARS